MAQPSRRRVARRGRRLRHRHGHLRTASGKQCQIINCRRAAYGYDQRIEVSGSKGMLRPAMCSETTVEFAGAKAIRDKLLNFFLERYEAAYRPNSKRSSKP